MLTKTKMKRQFYIFLICFFPYLVSGQSLNAYQKGIEFYKNADYANAENEFTKAIDQNTNQKYNSYTYRGLSKYNQKKYDDAYQDYNLAVRDLNKLGYTKISEMPADIQKAYGLTLYDRALTQAKRGQQNEAIKDFNFALLYKYNPGDCYSQIGNAYYALSDFQKSAENYTLSMTYKPNDYSLYYWRGNAYLSDGKWQQSIIDFDYYIQQKPKDPYGYHYRGYAHIMLDEIDEGLSDTQKSIDLDMKDMYLAFRNLGLLSTKLEDCAAAKENFESAIHYNPKDNFSKNKLESLSRDCKNANQKSEEIVNKTASKPTIDWIYPSQESLETSDNVVTIKTCVNSSEKPTMRLFADGIELTSRDFTIVPSKQVDCPYRFEKQVTLTSSQTTLKFVAKNSGGSMESSRKIYKTQSQNPEAEERRIALLIGNADYKFKPLTNTVNDVDDMAKKLESLGFKVIKYKNLTAEQMSVAFVKFGRELVNYDVGMFFYAGHGLQNGSGTNFLVPVDAEIIKTDQDFNRYCIEVDELFGQMKKANSKVNIIILDACRDNPLDSRNGTRGSGTRGLSAPTQNPQGSFIFYAASANQTALDGEGGRNGIFTGELLKYIDKPNLKLEEVVKETSKAVKLKTNDQQKPAWYSEFDGDFYFKH
jgi:tetratricopeptide (TPR) repeat protein